MKSVEEKRTFYVGAAFVSALVALAACQALLENRAGELAAVSQKLADGRVNMQAIYLTGIVDNLVELAIAVDNIEKAEELLG